MAELEAWWQELARTDLEAISPKIFEYGGTSMGEVNAIHYRRDFVLRGHRRTPDLD